MANDLYCVQLPLAANDVFFRLEGKPTLNSVIAKVNGAKSYRHRRGSLLVEVAGENCNGNTFAWTSATARRASRSKPNPYLRFARHLHRHRHRRMYH